MPTYEYACKACDHSFEIVQSFSEDSLTTCPECDQDALRKVYNAAGIIFKGDGWHIKDYAAASNSTTKPAAADDSGSTGTSSDTSSGSSDTKPSSSSGSGDSATKPAAS